MSEPPTKDESAADPPPGGGGGTAEELPVAPQSDVQQGDQEGDADGRTDNGEQREFSARFSDYRMEQHLHHADSVVLGPGPSISGVGTVSGIHYSMCRSVSSQIEPDDLPTTSQDEKPGSGPVGKAEPQGPPRQHVNIVVMVSPTESEETTTSSSTKLPSRNLEIPMQRAKSSSDVILSHRQKKSSSAKKTRSVNLEHLKEVDVVEIVRVLNAAFANQRTDSTNTLSPDALIQTLPGSKDAIRFGTVQQSSLKPATKEESVQAGEPPRPVSSTTSQTDELLPSGDSPHERPPSLPQAEMEELGDDKTGSTTERVYLLNEQQMRQAIGSDDKIIRFPHMDVSLRRVCSDRGRGSTIIAEESRTRSELPSWLQEFFAKRESSGATRVSRIPEVPAVTEQVTHAIPTQARQTQPEVRALVPLMEEGAKKDERQEVVSPSEKQLLPAEMADGEEEEEGGLFQADAMTGVQSKDPTEVILRTQATTAAENEEEAVGSSASEPLKRVKESAVEARVWTEQSGLYIEDLSEEADEAEESEPVTVADVRQESAVPEPVKEEVEPTTASALEKERPAIELAAATAPQVPDEPRIEPPPYALEYIFVPEFMKVTSSKSSCELTSQPDKKEVVAVADKEIPSQVPRGSSGEIAPADIDHSGTPGGSKALQRDLTKRLISYSQWADKFGIVEPLADADLAKIKLEFDSLPFPPDQEDKSDVAGKPGRAMSSSDFSSLSEPVDAIIRRVIRDVITTERFEKPVVPRDEVRSQDENVPQESLSVPCQVTDGGALDILTTEKVTRVREKLEYVEPVACESSSSDGSSQRLEECSGRVEFVSKKVVLRSEKDEELLYAEPRSSFASVRQERSEASTDDAQKEGAEKSTTEKHQETFFTTNIRRETHVKEVFQIVRPTRLTKRRATRGRQEAPSRKLVKKAVLNEVTFKQYLEEAEGRQKLAVEAEMVASFRPSSLLTEGEEDAGRRVLVAVEPRREPKREKRPKLSPKLAGGFDDELPSVDEIELSLHPPMGARTPPFKIDASTVLQAVDMADIPSAEEGEVSTTCYTLEPRTLPPRQTDRTSIPYTLPLPTSEGPSFEEADFSLSPVAEAPPAGQKELVLAESSLDHRVLAMQEGVEHTALCSDDVDGLFSLYDDISFLEPLATLDLELGSLTSGFLQDTIVAVQPVEFSPNIETAGQYVPSAELPMQPEDSTPVARDGHPLEEAHPDSSPLPTVGCHGEASCLALPSVSAAGSSVGEPEKTQENHDR
ncbi:uncharacterized protein LOC144146257 [Haemaphysalis longicornis]